MRSHTMGVHVRINPWADSSLPSIAVAWLAGQLEVVPGRRRLIFDFRPADEIRI